jgi:PAS domain S-box-containing protein
MNITLDTADTFLATVAEGDVCDPAYFPETLGELDAPIYVTDEEGFVTYFNRACVGFSGREPAVGKDRWCVTWKLFTADGDYLPHDQCPMAVAIKAGKPIRGVTAVAARPDGTRVKFAPFPTPLRDGSGKVVGAINILLDVTDVRQVSELRAQAERCRRLRATLSDTPTRALFEQMADEYEAKAHQIAASLGVAHGRDAR